VETDGKFILKNLINYPNPIIEATRITAEHNRPDEELKVTVSIFDMSGRIIRMIQLVVTTSGYQLSPIIWDGNTEGGKRAGRGIYPYNVSVLTPEGEKAVASGRMIIL
jgi:flagellar hook assembly protein FlgD